MYPMNKPASYWGTCGGKRAAPPGLGRVLPPAAPRVHAAASWRRAAAGPGGRRRSHHCGTVDERCHPAWKTWEEGHLTRLVDNYDVSK